MLRKIALFALLCQSLVYAQTPGRPRITPDGGMVGSYFTGTSISPTSKTGPWFDAGYNGDGGTRAMAVFNCGDPEHPLDPGTQCVTNQTGPLELSGYAATYDAGVDVCSVQLESVEARNDGQLICGKNGGTKVWSVTTNGANRHAGVTFANLGPCNSVYKSDLQWTTDRNAYYYCNGTSWVLLGPSTLPGVSSSGLLTSSLTLYVNGTTGSDSNDCTSAGAGACATIGGAIKKTPLDLAAPLVFSVAVYDAGYPGFAIPPWRLVDPADGGSVSVHFVAETFPDAVGLTSPVTGTATAGTAAAGPYSNWQGLTTSGLTASELRGYLIEITAGTRAGCRGTVYDNTTTDITFVGIPCSGAPDNTSVYHIRDSVNVTSTISTQSGAFDAGTTSPTGIQVQAGWTTPNRQFQTVYVQLSGIGVNVSSTSSAVKVAGGGGVSFLGSRIINRSSSAGSSAVSMQVGAVSFTNSYIHTGAANAIQTTSQSTPNKFTLTSSLADGANTTGAVIQAYGHQGSSASNAAVRILANTSQCNGIDVTGMRESQIDLAIAGAGSNNIAVVAMNQGNAAASSAMSGAYLTHMYFENVGTAFKLEGPQFVRSNASIIYGSNVGTVFDLAHGARVYRQGVAESSGYTTYLLLDGEPLSPTDLTDLGGDVMSIYSGTAFDSFP